MKKKNRNDEFYRSILFDSPLGYAYHEIILDDAGNPCDYRFLEVNPEFEKLTGLFKKDIIGKTVTEVIPNIKEDELDWISLYGDIALHQKVKKFTSHSIPLNRWYNIDAFSLKKNYFITVFTDITQMKEKEREINSLYDQREQMFTNHGANMLVIRIEDGRILYANPAAIEFYGYTEKEILSKTIWNLNTLDKDKVIELMKMAESKTLNFFTFTHRLKSGEIRNVDVYSSPINYNNNNDSLFSIIVDVTDRETAFEKIISTEEELIKSHLLLKASLNSPKDIIILSLDKDYNYLFFNDAHKQSMKDAYGADVKVGTCIFDYMNDDDVERIKRNYDKALNGNSHITKEVYGEFDKRTYESIFNPIIDEKNNIIGVSVYARDISELIEIEKKLENEKLVAQNYLDIAGVMIMILDVNGNIKLINKKGCSTLGVDFKDAINKNWFDSFIPNNIESDIKNIFLKVMNSKDDLKTLDYENPIINLNGDIKDILWHNTKLYDVDGNIIGVLCSGEDITELRNALRLKESSEKKLSMILSTVEEAVYGIDIDEKCTFVNKRFLDLLGYEESEVIGKDMHELIHHSHPDGSRYPSEDCPMKKAFKGGENVTIELDYIWKKNGEKIPVEFFTNPLYDDGKLLGAVVTFKNISDKLRYIDDLRQERDIAQKLRDKAELSIEELVLSNQKYNLLLESATDIVFTVDKSMKYKHAFGNGLDIIELNEEKFLNRSFSEVFGKDFWEERKERYELAFNGMKSEHTWKYKMKNKTTVFQTSIAPLFNISKEIIGAVGVSRDITNLQNKIEELEFVSYHDFLTGLYNRRYYEKKIEELELSNYSKLSIIMADINGLKLVNDAFGHQKGDELLVMAANLLKESKSKNDILCRIGGDEFVVLLLDKSLETAEKVVSNIKRKAKDIYLEHINLSISFGLASSQNKSLSIQDLFRLAEDRMYQSKLVEVPSMRGAAIKAIMTTLIEKDKYSEQHVRNVSLLSEKIAERMKLSQSEITEISTAALLHDIGKIIIPISILNKSSSLTSGEYEIVKTHSEIGFRILNSTFETREIAKVVLYHHERWDGKGYPKKLQKEDIPFESRIIAVADAFDAMTSYRSYKKTMTKEEALDELIRCSGTQFDPTIVDIFVKHFQDIVKSI